MTYEDKVALEGLKADMTHFCFLAYLLATSSSEDGENTKNDVIVARDNILSKFEDLLESRTHYKELWEEGRS